MKTFRNIKVLFVLSVLVMAFAVVGALGGLLIRSVYRDSEFIILSWRTNDMITILVAVPMLIISMFYGMHGSRRGYIVWMGLLLYMLYNYSFYLFGAAFNKLFLVYVTIVALSIYALIIGLSSFTVSQRNIFHFGFASRIVAVYLFLVTLPLLAVEGMQCVKFIVNDTLPSAPPLIFALDLTLVIPASLVAAILLWRNNSWGFVWSVLMLVKGFVYGLNLSIGTGILAYSEVFGRWDKLLPFYITVAIGGLAGAWILLKNVNDNLNHNKM
jgi:hypothetical protein